MNNLIQEICDKELNIKEKVTLLDELREQFNNDCGKAKSEITKDYIYCPFCDNYHQKNLFDISSQIVETYIKPDPYIGGGVPQLIDVDYFEKEEVIQYNYKCPNGHSFTTVIAGGSNYIKRTFCLR